MSFLIETDVLAHIRRRNTADARVAGWFNACEPGRVYLSAMTMFELEQTCEALLRKDLRKGAMFRLWLSRHVLPAFDDRILPLDSTVARIAAGLQASSAKSERTALVAATALTHKLSIVTGQGQEFSGTGAKVLDPWDA
jgi:toxin FitB